MNEPITRLFGLIAVLFLLLVAFTSRWTVFEADSLRANTLNKRSLFAGLAIPRGRIVAAGGDTIARSREVDKDVYERRYPNNGLFAHAVGYSFLTTDRTGLERFYNDQLLGDDGRIGSLADKLVGSTPEGNDVFTTLRPDAQRVAIDALAGRKGAVVAITPQSGAVTVMASVPTYDQNDTKDGDAFTRLNKDEDAPLVNRATQSTFPPGSTMKVVTAAAALDSGKYEPDSMVDGSNGRPISGVPLNNFGEQDFGRVSLTDALTNSVNTAWASVAADLGRSTMAEYMERFGFYAEPPLDYPDEQMAGSGARSSKTGKLLAPDSPSVDIGRLAIGQERMLATPLQMAMVAATVANDGELVEPHLMDRIEDEEGREVAEADPDSRRVMSRDSADKLGAMMLRVVDEGSGTAAALQGVRLAGKTGTAERTTTGLNDAWFIGFTNKAAVAVVLERTSGTGGELAAPIARRVLEALG